MIDYQLEAEEQRKIITVKKVMIETGIDRPESFPKDLVQIEKQNDLLFNEMNNNLDQVDAVL